MVKRKKDKKTYNTMVKRKRQHIWYLLTFLINKGSLTKVGSTLTGQIISALRYFPIYFIYNHLFNVQRKKEILRSTKYYTEN
jgi:hypothetical protein